MSNGLNKFFGIGNLCDDPQLRHTQGGQAVLNFRIAMNETFMDRDGNKKEKVEYLNVVVWGKPGESLAPLLHKGSRVHVEGKIQTSSYDDRDGNKRYKTEANAFRVILLDGRSHGGAEGGEQEQRSSGGGYSRARGGGNGGGGGKAKQDPATAPADEDYGGYGGDDDLPF